MNSRVGIYASLLLLLVHLAAGQAVAGASDTAVVYFYYKWADPPRQPGGPGVVEVGFYTKTKLVDLSVALIPRCGWVKPLEAYRALEAGPGASTARLVLAVERLNATCPAALVWRWRFTEPGLGQGGEHIEHVDIYVPAVPEAEAWVSGAAVYGLPAAVNLTVVLRGALGGEARLEASGARVLWPGSAVALRPGVNIIPLRLVAESYTPTVKVAVDAADAAGRFYTREIYLQIPVAPPPAVQLQADRPALAPGTLNYVNVTVAVPSGADGVAYLTVAGGSASRSIYVIEVRGGVGRGVVDVVPTSQTVQLRAEVYYTVGGVLRREEAVLTLATTPAAAMARVSAAPGVLVRGVVNNVTLSIAAPGAFNASVYPEGAASAGPTPLTVSGVNEARAVARLIPQGQSVRLRVVVSSQRWSEEHVVELPVVGGEAFLILPSKSAVAAGRGDVVPIRIYYIGRASRIDAYVVVTSRYSPPLLQKVGLVPGGYAVVNYTVDVPLTAAGPVEITCDVYYTTPEGFGGQERKIVELAVVREPRVKIASIDVAPRNPEAGRPVSLAVTLHNSGFATAYNVEVRLSAPGAAAIIGEAYLGQIQPQQSTATSLLLNATAPGNYTAVIQLRYMDEAGQIYTENATVTLAVKSRAQPLGEAAISGPGLAALAAVAAALVAAAAIAKRRGRQKTELVKKSSD